MTEAQEEEQPSNWSSHSACTWSELTVGTNEVLQVLEGDAFGLVLMCGSHGVKF